MAAVDIGEVVEDAVEDYDSMVAVEKEDVGGVELEWAGQEVDLDIEGQADANRKVVGVRTSSRSHSCARRWNQPLACA